MAKTADSDSRHRSLDSCTRPQWLLPMTLFEVGKLARTIFPEPPSVQYSSFPPQHMTPNATTVRDQADNDDRRHALNVCMRLWCILLAIPLKKVSLHTLLAHNPCSRNNHQPNLTRMTPNLHHQRSGRLRRPPLRIELVPAPAAAAVVDRQACRRR